MTLALSAQSPESYDARRKKTVPRLLTIAFFAISLALMIVGISSFAGAYVRSSDMPDGFTWTAPMNQVSARDLNPAAALIALTEPPAQDALNRTLEQGDLESVFALVAYDARLSDSARIGALLQLGTQYAGAKNLRRAAWSYQNAAFLATLSPLLSDFSRTETLLTASAGLRAADAKEAARRVLDEAYLIAVYSPSLRRQQRANRLNQIASAYQALNLSGIADQARDKAQEAASSADTPLPSPRTPFIPIPGSLPASPTLAQLKHNRAMAASQLLDDVAGDKPRSAAEWPKDSLSQLRYALLKEDEARVEYYATQFPAARDSFSQIALLTDKADWIALKLRVARSGFGAAIVPEWSKNPNPIADDLSDTWGELYQVFQRQTNALSNAQDVNQAAEDILKQQLIAVRWGWLQRAESELRAELAQVAIKLRDGSVPGLRLDSAVRDNKTMYLLVPDILYGQGAQVFPQ